MYFLQGWPKIFYCFFENIQNSKKIIDIKFNNYKNYEIEIYIAIISKNEIFIWSGDQVFS